MAINLRKELSVLYNKDKEYTWGIFRHLTDTICGCLQQPAMRIKPGTNVEEPNPNHRTTPNPECTNCDGSGRVYNEYLHKCQYFYPGYKWAHYGYEEEGMAAKNIYSIFLLANETTKFIYPNDWFFEIDRNLNGTIKMPITRRRRFIIKEVQRFYLDDSKMEYIRIFATPTTL